MRDYHPASAEPTERLDRLVHLRVSIRFSVSSGGSTGYRRPLGTRAALESVLEVPGTVARLARVPSLEKMPAGTLATSRLDHNFCNSDWQRQKSLSEG